MRALRLPRVLRPAGGIAVKRAARSSSRPRSGRSGETYEKRVDDELHLRTFSVEDAEALFRLTDSCRSYLREWLPWVDGTDSPTVTRSFIETGLRQLERNDGFQAGIWVRGELAGVVGLHRIQWANRFTSIGYWLGKGFQHRGIMTRSCAAVIRTCFADLGLHRVEIRCAVENAKSMAVIKRLGFREEGRLKDAEWLYDHFVDHVLYAQLEGEWRKRAG